MSTDAPSLLAELIQSLRALPGVGPRSAQRMAYHLLQHDRAGCKRLAHALDIALEQLQHCASCNNFSEQTLCGLCANASRDNHLLMVVEMPTDLLMLEQTHLYRGLYFVLMGHLSPIDGIGPHDIHLERLLRRIETSPITEVILATNFTVEGEATAHAIRQLLSAHPIKITRIARGIPSGGELEHTDSSTLGQALMERRHYDG